MRSGLIDEAELRQQSKTFLGALREALSLRAPSKQPNDALSEVRQYLQELSKARAYQGFSPAETATFVMSLKQPLFRRLQTSLGNELWACSEFLIGSGSSPSRHTRRAAKRSSRVNSENSWSSRRRSSSCGTRSSPCPWWVRSIVSGPRS